MEFTEWIGVVALIALALGSFMAGWGARDSSREKEKPPVKIWEVNYAPGDQVIITTPNRLSEQSIVHLRKTLIESNRPTGQRFILLEEGLQVTCVIHHSTTADGNKKGEEGGCTSHQITKERTWQNKII